VCQGNAGNISTEKRTEKQGKKEELKKKERGINTISSKNRSKPNGRKKKIGSPPSIGRTSTVAV